VTYTEFLDTKQKRWKGTGIGVSDIETPSELYPWQDAITRWALRKERACIFADCGLGKTFMQLAWAQAIPGRVLVLAPLCVAEQTVAEGHKIGVPVRYAATASDDDGLSQIVITNYERLHKFDVSAFAGVVLDESSILKSFDGKTRTALIATFKDTPYRLCCTATPSPNDIAELANHAEFLGLMTRPEFLATWFVHDDTGWRMKRHAVGGFYRWMASWAVALRTPSDLGYADDGFVLPKLRIIDHIVPLDAPIPGVMFPELAAKGIGGRLAVRRGSVSSRVDALVQCVHDTDQERVTNGCQWLIWCGLNTEADAAVTALSGAEQVAGKDTPAAKSDAIRRFVSGDIQTLITKPKILGFGMNFQQCHHMAFLGLSDSYESYYQCIRRCWRFGQRSPVDVHVVVSEAEQAVVRNVRRKEGDAAQMAADLVGNMAPAEREELGA